MHTHHFETIGIIRSPYKEKFGIPRQPGLVDAASTLELLPPYNRPEAVKGLDGFSHIWLTFVFHGVKQAQWRPTVRPPRLGGNERVGVFASRSTHRPNPIGLSVVRLSSVESDESGVRLHLRGADLLDGTPVLDIKPYIAYSDSIPEARSAFATTAPETHPVVINDKQMQRVRELEDDSRPGLAALLLDLLRYDHRPGYQSDPERIYGMRLYDLNLRWRYVDETVELVGLELE